MCNEGEGISNITGDRKCSPCPENTYNNDEGSFCEQCEDGFDTQGKTGATKCHSMFPISIRSGLVSVQV